MHLFRKPNRTTAAAAAPATPDVPKSKSGKILRLRSDGSADVSIEACVEPNEWNLRFDVQRNVALLRRNRSELRRAVGPGAAAPERLLSVQTNLGIALLNLGNRAAAEDAGGIYAESEEALLAALAEQLSEGSEHGEDQVETSLDSCLYVHACGIQLANNADPSLLRVGSSFMFCSISTQKSIQSGLSRPDTVGASLRLISSSSENIDSEEPALSVLKLQSDEGLNVFEAKNELQVQVHPP
jgi:hypothetical protein